VISLILGLFALLGFVAFAFHLHNKAEREHEEFQENINNSVKILEFSCGYELSSKSYARAKVIWDGQDFPVEFIRTHHSDLILAGPRGEFYQYGKWKSVDDFDSYFEMPKYVRAVLDKRYRQEYKSSYEKNKEEYLVKKLAEASKS
jgi:hypothetical protein